MDGYAPAFVAHNLPLLVVSGLGPSSREGRTVDGSKITSEIPPVESEDALALLKHFKEGDASNLAWNAREHSGRNKFRVKTVGRVAKQPQCLFVQSLNFNRNITCQLAARNFLPLLNLLALYQNPFCIQFYHR